MGHPIRRPVNFSNRWIRAGCGVLAVLCCLAVLVPVWREVQWQQRGRQFIADRLRVPRREVKPWLLVPFLDEGWTVDDSAQGHVEAFTYQRHLGFEFAAGMGGRSLPRVWDDSSELRQSVVSAACVAAQRYLDLGPGQVEVVRIATNRTPGDSPSPVTILSHTVYLNIATDNAYIAHSYWIEVAIDGVIVGIVPQ
jgi:hypothetical protein